jgi:hypothetical protein
MDSRKLVIRVTLTKFPCFSKPGKRVLLHLLLFFRLTAPLPLPPVNGGGWGHRGSIPDWLFWPSQAASAPSSPDRGTPRALPQSLVPHIASLRAPPLERAAPECCPRAPPPVCRPRARPRAPPTLQHRPPPSSLCAHVARQDWSEWDGGGCYVHEFGGAGEEALGELLKR